MDLKEIIACLNDPIAIEKAAKEARYIVAVAEAKANSIIASLNRDLRMKFPETYASSE